ncbi:M20 family metallopeptidase [Rhodococcus koreensis]|uniref:M20 metallopeptidase family protein n=1 Tax=Rhodococcus koreensis TaxID=99653 RepID=UPI003670AC11
MRSWRRHLHAHPELGFQEHRTAAFIRSLLDEWQLPYTTPLETATVVSVRGDIDGPVLLIRADIDALPIQEENRTSYASTRPGVMHACGHDGHTAILLGIAKWLSRCGSAFRGEVRLLFQPAEEPVPSGAPALIEAGVLEGAAAAVGLHLSSWLDTGEIALTKGEVMASDDRFDITIIGSGGHPYAPHDAVDALTIASDLVSQLSRLVSQRIDPLSSAVVTIGSFHSGDTYNAIPSEAHFSGTVRTLSAANRNQLEADLVGLTNAYAAAHHATAKVSYLRSSPPLLNSARVVDYVRPAAAAVVGADRVTSPSPTMGSEDFAFYSERIPSAYAFVGARNGVSLPHHHPRFDIDEEALAIGFRYFANIVDRWIDPSAPEPNLHVPAR